MTPDQPWMWHWGGMWIFPIIMIVLMIVIFGMFFARGGCGPSWWCHGGHHRRGGEIDSAIEILKKRYARGEITKEEFEQMKKDISD